MADQTQYGNREYFQQAITGGRRIGFFCKYLLSDIETIIVQRIFACSPSAFVLKQAAMAEVRAAEVNGFVAGFKIVLNCRPHDQIVGTKVVETFVRGSELIDSSVLEVKKDGTCNDFIAMNRQKEFAFSGLQHLFENCFKKIPWLRRQSMAFAGQAIQMIEIAH